MKTPFTMSIMPKENAFWIMATFNRSAKRAGRTPEEIKESMDKAKSGDYKHLCNTLKAEASQNK